jgi:ribosomal protein L30/L7E
MIAVIRIKGMINLRKVVSETLDRMKLRRKYSCVIIEPTQVNLGMIKQAKDAIAYGEIDEATLKELKEKRSTKIENFFRLHPPRGGIDAKKHFGVHKGVLGDNGKDINKLITRML